MKVQLLFGDDETAEAQRRYGEGRGK